MMEIVSNFMNSVCTESVAKSTTRHPTATRHPEFISGSISDGKILKQVQHDESVILKQVQYDECGAIMYDLVNIVRPELVEGQVMRSYFDTLSMSGAMV